MKNNNEKRAYLAPRLTVVSFCIEHGYAGSPTTRLSVESASDNSQTFETFENQGYFGGSDDWVN